VSDSSVLLFSEIALSPKEIESNYAKQMISLQSKAPFAPRRWNLTMDNGIFE